MATVEALMHSCELLFLLNPVTSLLYDTQRKQHRPAESSVEKLFFFRVEKWPVASWRAYKSDFCAVDQAQAQNMERLLDLAKPVVSHGFDWIQKHLW